MITGNEPAMPIVEENIIEDHLGTVMQMHFSGLTIRQHFASMAMQGLMSAGEYNNPDLKGLNEKMAIASYAVQFADALITELNKE